MVIVKTIHDSIFFFKGSCPKDFIIHCIDLVGCLFYLLYPTLLSLVSLFLVCLFLPKLFLMFFSSVFFSNVSNFFPIIPNIPDQTSYYPIYTMSLLYILLVILLYETLYSLLFLPILISLYILLQTFLLGPLHSLSSPLVPKCLLPLYIPSIILGTYSFF